VEARSISLAQSYTLPALFFDFFCGTGVWTQGFTLEKQVFYCLSHTSSPFCSGYCGDGGLKSQVAKITGMRHWCLALVILFKIFSLILIFLLQHMNKSTQRWRDIIQHVDNPMLFLNFWQRGGGVTLDRLMKNFLQKYLRNLACVSDLANKIQDFQLNLNFR
jgi:hypothetical protein